jgi:hypothetical protein
MFLYTSEVFSQLPKALRRGVEPNGLAALGELIGTSLGANRTEGELLERLGVNGADVEQPYKRVFPIGNTHGQRGAVFGDGSQETVYRAIGRGLASLVSSPVALHEFLHYDMTNGLPQPTDLKWLGEGSQSDDAVQWGSFGYARLSLGRDRYGEYVAQRLSRMALDRVVAGHVREDSQSGDADLREAAADWVRRVERDLGLPTELSAVALLGRGGRMEQVKNEIRRTSREAIQREVLGDSMLSASGMPGAKFLQAAMTVVGRSQADLQRATNDQAYVLVHSWQWHFVADLLAELDRVIADKGILVARQVVLAMRDRVADWHDRLVAESGRLAPQGSAFTTVPAPDLVAAIKSQQSISMEHPLRKKLSDGLAESLSRTTAGIAAGLLAEVLKDFWPSFGEPLVKAMADQHGRLVGERSRPVRPSVGADLRTNVYAEWPVAGSPVPDRFRGANNEVVLMNVDKFPAQFDTHVQSVAAVRTGGTMTAEALDSVLREIITDRWSGRNEALMGSAIIEMRSRWVPEKLTVDPTDPSSSVQGRSTARFDFRLSPEQILGRARDWVWRADGEIGPYLKEGLRSYMDPVKREFEARRVELASQFQATIQQALPLVSVDSAAFGEVHASALVEDFKFSSLPFEGLAGVDDMLRLTLQERPSVSQKVVGVFDNALGQGTSVAHIDIFGSYAPMSPLAFPSLLQPLINSWRESVAQNNTGFFWTNRRARPLTGSLAMSVAERQASTAGYVVGRITGRMRGTYETKANSRPQPIEVYSQSKGRWLAFPNPLLTPYATGKNGKRLYLADELPALLESQLLAIAECGFKTSLEPLLPYVELRHLYGKVVQAQVESDAVDAQGRSFDNATGAEYLRAWIVDAFRPKGGPAFPEGITDEDGDPFDLTDPQGRRDAAVRYCVVKRDSIARAFHTDEPVTNRPHFTAFDRRPMVAAQADDLVWAFDAVVEIIDEIELDDAGAEPEELEGLGF